MALMLGVGDSTILPEVSDSPYLVGKQDKSALMP